MLVTVLKNAQLAAICESGSALLPVRDASRRLTIRLCCTNPNVAAACQSLGFLAIFQGMAAIGACTITPAIIVERISNWGFGRTHVAQASLQLPRMFGENLGIAQRMAANSRGVDDLFS
jgi:hypothetical protein